MRKILENRQVGEVWQIPHTNFSLGETFILEKKIINDFFYENHLNIDSESYNIVGYEQFYIDNNKFIKINLKTDYSTINNSHILLELKEEKIVSKKLFFNYSSINLEKDFMDDYFDIKKIENNENLELTVGLKNRLKMIIKKISLLKFPGAFEAVAHMHIEEDDQFLFCDIGSKIFEELNILDPQKIAQKFLIFLHKEDWIKDVEVNEFGNLKVKIMPDYSFSNKFYNIEFNKYNDLKNLGLLKKRVLSFQKIDNMEKLEKYGREDLLFCLYKRKIENKDRLRNEYLYIERYNQILNFDIGIDIEL